MPRAPPRLPPEVHIHLDEQIPPYVEMVNLEVAANAEEILQSVLRRCQEAYSTTWPINVTAANQALLASRPDILCLLKSAQKTRKYAKIRELSEFHVKEAVEEELTDEEPTESNTRSNARLIQKAVQRATNCIDPYFQKKPQLPIFELPPDVDDETRKHVSDLKLPVGMGDERLPSLLLHNLRNHVKAHSKRLKRLYEVPDTIKFLCNTSGSGKNRLLLEGLTTRWGFYFTSSTGDGIGSNDLFNILESLRTSPRLRNLPPTHYEHTLQRNVAFTHKRFATLLLARVIIMAIFVERLCAEAKHITDEHKEQWLFIQLAPIQLMGEDIFAIIADQLRGLQMDYDGLLSEITAFSLKIDGLLGLTLMDMICVIDEAQRTSDMLTTKFLSIDGESERPVLHEQLVAWSAFMPHILVSGTGLSMTKIERIINSTVVKDMKLNYEVFTETGAFDKISNQRRYLDQYFPPGYFNTAKGEVLLRRLGYWLHGRHRFTAAYVARVIATGFKSPHRTLNKYVKDVTSYEPMDAATSIEEEPLVDTTPASHIGFPSHRLGKDDGLRRLIASVVFDYIGSGSRPILLTGEAELVEFGVARFVSGTKALVDEPLALLAVANYFSENTSWTREYFHHELLRSHVASIRGFAMEHFVAFLLGFQFSSPRPLSDVFKFIGNDRCLFHRKGRLVALQRVNGRLEVHPVDLSNSLKGSTYRHSYRPSSPKEFAYWLHDPNGIPFCFPPPIIGPDTCFALLLDDGTLLWVMEQSKLKKSGAGAAFCKEALIKTVPENFMTELRDKKKTVKKVEKAEKEGKARVVTNPAVQKTILQSLDEMDNRTNMAGGHSVLRVLVCYPAKPVIHAGDVADDGDHPVASVDFDKLITSDATKQILDALSRNALMKEIDEADSSSEGESEEEYVSRKRARVV